MKKKKKHLCSASNFEEWFLTQDVTDSLFTSEKLRITLSFSEVLLIMHWAGLQLLHRGKEDGQRAKGKKKVEFRELGLLYPLMFSPSCEYFCQVVF